MRLIIRDTNGNTLGIGDRDKYLGNGLFGAIEFDVKANDLVGASVHLGDDGNTLILALAVSGE